MTTMLSMMTTQIAAQDDYFYIFLCIGQSNMVGQGQITDADKIEDKGFLSLSAIDGHHQGRMAEK